MTRTDSGIAYPTAEEYAAAEAVLCGSYLYRLNGTDYALVEDTNGDLFYYVPGVGFRAASISDTAGELIDL